MSSIFLRIFAFCLLCFIAAWFLIFYTSILNKRYQTIEKVKFIDGSNAEIFGKHSKAGWSGGYFGFQYGINQQSVFEWERKGIKYIFKTHFKPIVFAEDDNACFIVVIDDETDFRHPVFKFYSCINSEWEEILYTDFPKKLAFQNSSLNRFNPKKLDFEERWFHDSYMGRLWVMLEYGSQLYSGRDYPNEFYENYIKQYGFKESMFPD